MNRMRAAMLIVAVFTAALTTSSWGAETRVALVIGNANYTTAAKLPNTENDARSIAGLLRSIEFDSVELALNETANQLRATVQRFARQAAGADIAFVFYAGHGIEIQGNNYLVPVDAQLKNDLDIDFEAISLNLLMRAIAPAKRLGVVVLDACRDNPFLSRMEFTRGASRGTTRGLARVDPPGDTLVAYAAKAGAVAADGTGRNSPFTTALLKHLATPGLDVRLVLGRVRDSVIELTDRQQEPTIYGSMGGREVYLRPLHNAAAPQNPTPPISSPVDTQAATELAFWESVRNSNSGELFRRYLERYPNGTFAPLARARIKELEKPAIAALPPPALAPPPPALAPPPPALAPQSPVVPFSGSGTLRIGVAGPMTGASAAFGAQLKNGVEQAVADINAAGGILGKKIEVFVGDDRADPREGVSVANKFVGDGVKFVVGHFNSGVTIPSSEVLQENGILEITPAATNPKVTERGMWNIFRTGGRDDQQGPVAGNFIAEKYKGKRIAVVHDKTIYGEGVASGTRKAMNTKGIKEVLFEGVNAGDKDFSALVSKIKAARADLVYWGGLHDTGGLILRQLRDQGVKATFMGADGITDSEFAVIAGPGAEGTLMTFSPDPRNNPANRAIIEVLRKKGFEPEAYALYSYAAVQVIKQAAEQAKSLDPKKVAEVMHSGKVFNTVLGDLSFDKKGDVTGYTVGGRKKDSYVLYVWKKGPDGRITYVEQ
jgi:branched-chain amino acid transport system substrate-binding protein